MRRAFFLFVFIIILLVIILPSATIGVSQRSPSCGFEEKGRIIRLVDKTASKTIKIPLEEYLVGVVAAEMPAMFDEEALCAQAVAARTYVVKRLDPPKGAKDIPHNDADICSDHTHCQAWISRDEMKKRWGTNYFSYTRKIEKAVRATKGAVIYFQDDIVDPLYHASCGGGATEKVTEVWKNEVPYLKSVTCPEDPKAPQIKQDLSFTVIELQKLLKEKTILPVKPGAKTSTGRWKTLYFGGNEIKAQDLRTLLGLKSTRFSWEVKQNTVIFHVTGYGHAVGLCQRGANTMALQGKTWRQILLHYYPGTEIR